MIILFEAFVNEKYAPEVEFYDMSDEYQDWSMNMNRELFMNIEGEKKILFKLINNIQYKNALIEFVRYGEFLRFPSKIINGWKDLVLENIFKLSSLTSIHGHSGRFPYDDFYDVFDYGEDGNERSGEFTKWCKLKEKEQKEEPKDDRTYDTNYSSDYNWISCYEFLSKVKKIDDYTPQFSNGHYVLSDYATEPLEELGHELDLTESPEETIVVLNKILDVTHQRSDIAELFIKGGSNSLDVITNN